MPDYVAIHATLPDDAEETLAEALSSSPILGVQLAAAGPGLVEVSVWAEAGDPATVRRVEEVLRACGSPEVRRMEHDGEDWSARWRAGLTAFEVGRRWWIDPHPDRPTPAPGDRLRLAIEPRAAFGSGTHESTQLVLLQLEALPCHGLEVLDVGTGSGVLAIAADRLGAATVVAVDTDPIAAWEARATARSQPWTSRPLVIAGGVECLGDGKFDLVLCNMILSELRPLVGAVRRRLAPGGAIVLSGLLEAERDLTEELLARHGLMVDAERTLRGWLSVRAVPRPERS